MKAHVTDYALYRWRYSIGYLFIIAVVISILAVSALYVPGALRQGEIDAALASGKLSVESIDPAMVVNLPYHLLQRVSFSVLGVTTLSIKLPSIVLGALTAVGVFLLVRTWFRRNVAVLATVLAVTTTQFLFLIQDGTPAITFSFITIWLLTISTYVTRGHTFTTFWKVAAGVLMAAALYVPFGIYVVLALIITASFHPHIRYVIRRVARSRVILAILLGLVAMAPLAYAIVLKPEIGLTLLGLPNHTGHLVDNIVQTGHTMFGLFSPSTSYIIQPLYSLGVMLLMGIGVYKLLTVKHTARSYTVLILSMFVLPIVAINPEHTAVLYPLAVLMIAMGIATLIINWYKLFPRNPYARVAGLVPLSIFAAGMIFTGVMRYINNYTYNPQVLSHYSTDLRILHRTLDAQKSTGDTTRLVVSPNQQPFYTMVAHYDKRFAVATDYVAAPKTLIVAHDAYTEKKPSAELVQIVTNRRASDADRFYIYKTPAN